MASFFRRKDAPPASPNSTPTGATEGEDQAALLQRIASLKEKNERLEIRFRDVVGAYKSLMKEKETLEKSLAATTSLVAPPRAAAASTPSHPDLREGTETSGTEDDSAAVADVPSEAEGGRGGNSALVTQLQAQIGELTRAVAEITQARSSDAALFAADKRATAEAHRQALADLRSEMEAKMSVTDKCLVEERETAARELARRAQQISDLVEAASSRQVAWDIERKTYAENLAALSRQQQSGDSLGARVRELGAQLQQARDAELAAIARLSDTTTALKNRIGSLEEELAMTQARLASVAHQGDSEEILKLKQELRTARKAADAFREEARTAVQQQTLAIRVAQERVEASEQAQAALRAQLVDAERGNRGGRADDEARVAELSQLLGECTAARRDDALTIARLQQDLADAAARQASELRRRETEHAAAVEELRSQVALLSTELQRVQSGILDDDAPSWLSQPPTDTHPQVLVARSEAIRLHLRVQALQDQLLLSQQQARAAESAAALDASFSAAAPHPLAHAQPATNHTHAHAHGHTYSHNSTPAPGPASTSISRAMSPPPRSLSGSSVDPDATLDAQILEWRPDHHARDAEHARVIEEWANRFTKLRDRTTALLQDKDDEIARLRRTISATTATPREGDDSSTLQSGAPFVAYSSLEAQLARERENFRTRVRELEAAQVDEAEARALIEEQVDTLKSEIRRLERTAGRSGANLEYLKNIVVKLLTHAVPRDRVIPVIARILQFSPDELRAVSRAS
eukprot:m.110596 g.110596  ORF g.110596 m.110596 type:complete len:755 (+) comp14333_c2_seq4:133-2397(+)